MIYPVIGTCIGILFGLVFPGYIPTKYSQYVAVAILASLDSVFGGISAKFEGTYNEKIFISGFVGNAIIAVALTLLGDKLDLNLYLAAVVVFGTRLFQNFAKIRRYLLNLNKKTDKIK